MDADREYQQQQNNCNTMRSIFRIKSLFCFYSPKPTKKYFDLPILFFRELYLSCERCFAVSVSQICIFIYILPYSFARLVDIRWKKENWECEWIFILFILNERERKQMLFTQLHSTRLDSTRLDLDSLHYKIYFFLFIIKHNVVHIRMYTCAVSLSRYLY